MKKILTLIIDGIGISDKEEGNALKKAKMPNYTKLLEEYPNTIVSSSGTSVGLSDGQIGNSMVGYTTISAGQIIKQKSSYAGEAVDIDALATNPALKNLMEKVKKNKSTIHIMGLMSDGGISSNIDNTIKLINFLKTQEVKIVIDFIADGKDVETKSALKYIEMLEETETPIVSVCGRYNAMDAEEKWDRTKIYYDLVRNGTGLRVKEIRLALKNCYIRNITDEFLPPMLIESDKNIKDNDAIIWMNYNEEGAVQILTALTNNEQITEFPTKRLINVDTLLLFPVNSKVNATVLISEEMYTSNSLGLYLSKLGLTQARIADRRNFDYVTYYFNGEIERKLPKCNNYLIEAPKMDEYEEGNYNSAAITKQIMKCMEKDVDFILASISSVDAAGHSGKFEEAVNALEFVDECIGKIIECAELNFYTIIILSTHGNVESMLDEEEKIKTINTNNKVPFIMTDKQLELVEGSLTGIAPTILSYMDIAIPESMKNSKLLIKE